ncbi:uncharacterized protein METZ01_LOCUS266752, partial [marine metagenome]
LHSRSFAKNLWRSSHHPVGRRRPSGWSLGIRARRQSQAI